MNRAPAGAGIRQEEGSVLIPQQTQKRYSIGPLPNSFKKSFFFLRSGQALEHETGLLKGHYYSRRRDPVDAETQ